MQKQCEDYENNLRESRRALSRNPPEPHILFGIASTYFRKGSPDCVLSLCADLWRRGVHSMEILGLGAASSAAIGDLEGVLALADPDKWLSPATNLVPRGHDSELSSALIAHPGLVAAPDVNSTSEAGMFIGSLAAWKNPYMRRLLTAIERSVDQYVRDRARFSEHPFIESRPPQLTMRSWALVMKGSEYQGWHYHPGAWLSGVYYLSVPNRIAVSSDIAGSIEFGPLPVDGFVTRVPWPRRWFTPEEGRLLLFPSYFGHRTWATDCEEPRICVAVDILSA